MKIGDRVKVIDSADIMCGMKGTITWVNDSHFDVVLFSGYRSKYKSGSLGVLTGLEAMRIGDIIATKDGGQSRILGVGALAFLRSRWGDFGEVGKMVTYKKANILGLKIRGQEEDEIKVVTIEEVAAKFKVDVKNLKIMYRE